MDGISVHLDRSDCLYREVAVMELSFATASFLMLLAGIVLSVITIRRMVSGAICIPRWSKLVLIIGMILMNLILFLSILPPVQSDVYSQQPESIAPLNPIETIEAAQ